MPKLWKTLSQLAYLCRGHRRSLALPLLLAVLTAVADIASVALFGRLTLQIVAQNAPRSSNLLDNAFIALGLGNASLTGLGIAFVAIGLLRTLFALASSSSAAQWCYGLEYSLRMKTIASYLARIPYQVHINTRPSDVKNLITHGLRDLSGTVIWTLLGAISSIISGAAIAATSIFISPGGSALVFCLLGLFAVIHNRMVGVPLRSTSSDAMKSQNQLSSMIGEAIEGLKEVRLFQRQQWSVNRIGKAANERFKLTVRYQTLVSTPRILVETLPVFVVIFLIFFNYLHDGDAQTALPAVAMFGMALLKSIPPLNALLASNAILRAYSHLIAFTSDQLMTLEKSELTTPPVTSASPTPKPFSFATSLELRDVTYAHTREKTVLRGVSLQIGRGELVAISGPSGMGKSTLVDVLIGLLTPQSGEILVDGQPLLGVSSEWQSVIGFVPQQPFLFDASLQENIALADSHDTHDDARLRAAIEDASLQSVFAARGQHAIGERGSKLSGGERQRIGLARALYFERQVLIMDEPTSGLDKKTARAVMDAVTKLRGTKTIIVVSHQTELFTGFDRIFSVENGTVVEAKSA